MTVMPLKIAGVIRKDKIRDILLFEADFNFSNKLYFGKRLTKRAQNTGVPPQEKNDISLGHMSIELAVIRSLLCDYVRQRRRNSALGSYDA